MTTQQITSKDKIMLAARKLFGAHGYAETTIKKVSEEAGVAFGLIPHYFGSKEKLFVAASLSVLDDIFERLGTGKGDSPNGLVAVMRFVERYLSCSVDPDMHFMILVRCSPYSDIKLDINKDDIIFRFEQLIAELAQRIERGVEDGSVMPCEPKKMADVIFATIVGAVRTQLLTPYCPLNFYEAMIQSMYRSIEKVPGHTLYEFQLPPGALCPRY
ncbi:MAG: TetR/AcrR family transcriptional regulator [Desulfovibrionaceae bacterium]